MKLLILSAFLVVSAANLVNAQNTRDTATKKTAAGKKATTNPTNPGAANKGAIKNTTTSGNVSSGVNADTTRNVSTATQQGNAPMNNPSGQMTSTERYAAMGVQMGNLDKKDLKFVVKANSSNKMELQLSQMAAQKATSPAVKEFATMVVQHHTTAEQEIKQMLTSKGAMIPDTVMLPRHKMRMEMLQTLQGAEFDKAYMRIMVDAHEEDVDEFEDETSDAKDADLRAFATKMLPHLYHHYTRAKEVRKQL